MKKFYSFTVALLVSAGALGATFNLFSPASGVLKGNPSTYVTSSATSTDVKGLWTGTCDNTTYLRGDGSCQTPPGTGGGTVNSVALSAPSVFSIAGSPVTTTGTLALTFAGGQTANQFLASPNGTTGAIGLRSIVLADLPTITAAKGGTGVTTLSGIAKGNGTSAFSVAASSDVIATWSGTCSSSTFLRGDGSCQTPATGTGTVTSVALTVPSGFSVGGSPITTSGTLAISGTLNPAAGGTGVATLSGIAKGNGTSAFTTAVSGDVISTWGGTCNGTTYLRGDGTCVTPPTGGSSANPSATVGLTAVNGSAGTFLRSDGAPALSQSISPTMTGDWLFTGGTNGQIAVSDDAQATGSFIGVGGNAAFISNINDDGASVAVSNANAGSLALSTMRLTNNASRSLSLNLTSSGYSGSIGTSQFSGQMAAIGTTGSTVPISLQTNSIERIAVAGDGSVINLKATAVQVNGTAISTAIGANPSVSAGLSAVNGSASTFLRSDGAPALSQAISPTWTGTHIFSPTGASQMAVFEGNDAVNGGYLRIRDAANSGAVRSFIGYGPAILSGAALTDTAIVSIGGAIKMAPSNALGATFSSTGLSIVGAVTTTTGSTIAGTGGVVAGTDRLAIDNNVGITRLYAYGHDTSTNGLYEFHSVRSNGTNDITPLQIAGAGNVTINAPFSGTGLAVNATNASTAALDIASGHLKIAGSAGTAGQVLTSGGSSAAPSWTSASASILAGGSITTNGSGSCSLTTNATTGLSSCSASSTTVTITFTASASHKWLCSASNDSSSNAYIVNTGAGNTTTATVQSFNLTSTSPITWSVVNPSTNAISYIINCQPL